jgi:hypothetical protein
VTLTQPALDGTIPEPAADDYEEWIDLVWDAYVRAADSGQPFTISEVAENKKLPDPPKPQSQWGHLPGRLVKAGLIEPYIRTGKSSRRSVHKSLVNMWIGIPAHLRHQTEVDAA